MNILLTPPPPKIDKLAIALRYHDDGTQSIIEASKGDYGYLIFVAKDQGWGGSNQCYASIGNGLSSTRSEFFTHDWKFYVVKFKYKTFFGNNIVKLKLSLYVPPYKGWSAKMKNIEVYIKGKKLSGIPDDAYVGNVGREWTLAIID